jgi:hypothetical protein
VLTSGCFENYRNIPLDLPPKPVPPSVADSDLVALPLPVYIKLAQRDLMACYYQYRLELTIISTWADDDKKTWLRRNRHRCE